MKVADMHCDTILHMEQGGGIELAKNNLHIDVDKLKKGDYLVQNFAMFVDLKKYENPLERCMDMIDTFYLELKKNEKDIALALNYEDIMRNQKENKISALLTIEEGAATKGKLSYLRDFYRLGVRMITLTWNYENGIGFPNVKYITDGVQDFKSPNEKDGLTKTGIALVEEMERLGIIIDVSHLSDAGFLDVLKYTKKPFVASHSNARSVCNCVRNLPDSYIKRLSERGGVMGINYCADFLTEAKVGEKNISTVDAMVKHIKHIVSVGGIECVGLGSDFDGISCELELSDASKMSILADRLEKEGFSEAEVEKIFYKNVMRLYKDVLK